MIFTKRIVREINISCNVQTRYVIYTLVNSCLCDSIFSTFCCHWMCFSLRRSITSTSALLSPIKYMRVPFPYSRETLVTGEKY